MNFLAGLSNVATMGGGIGTLLAIMERAEREGVDFFAVEAAGSVYLGVGEAEVVGLDQRQGGPVFLESGFFPETLILRRFPVVVVAGSNRLEVEVFEGKPRDSRALSAAISSTFPPARSSRLIEFEQGIDLQVVRERIAVAVAQISSGGLSKLVVSAEEYYRRSMGFGVARAAAKLKRSFQRGHLYASPRAVGVSPELVLQRIGDVVNLNPLAGTAGRGGQVALLKSEKDQWEHRVMVEQLVSDLRTFAKEINYPEHPILFDAGRLIHLATPIRGLVPPGVSFVEILLAITPTAAIGGVPRAEAVEVLKVLEPDRGLYGGLVGLVAPDGDGEAYLAIRGAYFDGPTVRIVGGGGIVASSFPEAEEEEFRSKILATAKVLASG